MVVALLTLIACNTPRAGFYEMSGDAVIVQPDNPNGGWINTWWEVADAGLGAFRMSEGTGWFDCRMRGTAFTCDDLSATYDRDTCYEGCTDAEITFVDRLGGVLLSDERFSATRSWERTCAGEDCGATSDGEGSADVTGRWVAEDAAEIPGI